MPRGASEWLDVVMGMQATFVEHLRVECADERMQLPSLREEKTAVRGYSRMRAEDMVERRDVHPLGIAKGGHSVNWLRRPSNTVWRDCATAVARGATAS